MSRRSAADFETSLAMLPADLARRARSLRKYALRAVECPACLHAQESVWLAFDATYLGDLGAAAAMLEKAETAQHEHRARSVPQEQPLRMVPGFAGRGPLFAASDAAAYKRNFGGLGFVLSDGRWGMGRRVPDTGWRVLDPSGRSKVARALEATGTLTSAVVGTPVSMAPEQLGGGVAGPPTDVWAWACTISYAACPSRTCQDSPPPGASSR